MKYRLKNRQTVPPNGFIVRFRKLKAEQQYWSFNAAVSGYIEVANANPKLGLPTDAGVVADIVDEQNAARVALIPGAVSYIVQVDGRPVPENVNVNLRADVKAGKTCCGGGK